MYRITKEFHFSASHILNGLPENHPCSRLHGHNYIVVIELASRELNRVGFVVDFGDLKALKRYIDVVFDHRHLNDIDALKGLQPSAEVLAEHFFFFCKSQWVQTSKVSVSETPKCWASYEEQTL